MNDNVPPVPYKVPVIDKQGLLTTAWVQWFRAVFIRIGGHEAPTISQLANQSSLDSTDNEIDGLRQGPVL